MNLINPAIMKVLSENNNIITTSQVLSLGFSRQILLHYVHMGVLERVRHGIYILQENVHDDMYTMMLRSNSIIFSHESSLFLNKISDRTPFIHTITLPSNKVVPSSIKNECIYFYIKPELHKIGMIQRETSFGNKVRCYDVERTICDFLRTRSSCDEETVISALKNYAKYEKKDLNLLANYAKQFKVDTELKRYLEVLL